MNAFHFCFIWVSKTWQIIVLRHLGSNFQVLCKASQDEKLVARFQGTFGIWDWLLVPMFIINMICVHRFSNLIGTFSLMFPTYIFYKFGTARLSLHSYQNIFHICWCCLVYIVSYMCVLFLFVDFFPNIPTYKGSFGIIVIVWN